MKQFNLINNKGIVDYFINRLAKSDDPSQCWEWKGALHKHGYGDMSICIEGKPKAFRVRAHRYAYAYFNQFDIPEGLCVCHKCDNPKCRNPNHLFLGTPKDNYDDAVKKTRLHTLEMRKASGKKSYGKRELNNYGQFTPNGYDKTIRLGKVLTFQEKSKLMKQKSAKGEQCRHAKLKAEQIGEILELRAEGLTYKEIGAIYQVDSTCIYKIAKGKRWQHIDRSLV